MSKNYFSIERRRNRETINQANKDCQYAQRQLHKLGSDSPLRGIYHRMAKTAQERAGEAGELERKADRLLQAYKG